MGKLLFLGYAVPYDSIASYSGISLAGNKMQLSILEELSLKGVDLRCVTVPPIAVFPKDKHVLCGFKRINLFKNIFSTQIGFVNLPILKQLSQIRSTFRTIKNIITKEKIDKVLCFNTFPQIGTPIKKLKKRFPNVKVTCLLADLPIDDNPNRNFVSKYLRYLFEKETINNLFYPDNYIILNKYVVTFYKINKPYLVVEGGINLDNLDYSQFEKKVHNVVFSGALTDYNGVNFLLSSFASLERNDIYLDIYGDGPLKSIVEDYASRFNNIRYFGRIDNIEMMRKQREAWALINPRDPGNNISKLTFPSKTFEYLVSGTPVISTKLNGYSNEMLDHLFLIDEDKSLGEVIDDLLSIGPEEMKQICISNYEFVRLNYSWSLQATRILSFMEKYDAND